jgi:hypothetical protein
MAAGANSSFNSMGIVSSSPGVEINNVYSILHSQCKGKYKANKCISTEKSWDEMS